MRLQLRSLVAAVALLFAVSPFARAVDVIFDLSQLPGKSSPYSLTSGGYTLQFTLIGGSGGFSGNANGVTTSVSETFSISKTAGATDLIFKSYKIGNVSIDSGKSVSFNLTGGTGTSTGNTFTANTTLNYNGSYSLVGSQTVTYSMVNFGADWLDYVRFNDLTFTAVPEPSTYALGAIATGVMAAIARRRKARNA